MGNSLRDTRYSEKEPAVPTVMQCQEILKQLSDIILQEVDRPSTNDVYDRSRLDIA